MLNKNIETFMCCDKPSKTAQTILFGAPYDSTTSYRPGTRFGPAAIRHESYGIESYSPYLDQDLEDCPVTDCGDLELCFGNSDMALSAIEQQTSEILSAGKRPFMLGGEHLVTLGAFRAVHCHFPDIQIIHFDAHADLREDYLGNRLSHACVLRRCHEIAENCSIFQFGIRSGDRSEFRFSDQTATIQTQKFNFDTLEQVIEKMGSKPVYFTLDMDVLDPSVFPGTGTPEPGGVTFEQLRQAATLVCSRANVVACDVNELSPHYDSSGISTITACKIVREMLLSFSK